MMRKIAVEFLDDNSEIEVACYGADSDWVCRLTDPLTQPKGSVSDAFAPFPDLGFLWFREVGDRDRLWVVSGMVSRCVFQDEAWFDDLLYRISNEILYRDYQLARRIEFVSVDVTVMFDGERGKERFRGGKVAEKVAVSTSNYPFRKRRSRSVCVPRRGCQRLALSSRR